MGMQAHRGTRSARVDKVGISETSNISAPLAVTHVGFFLELKTNSNRLRGLTPHILHQGRTDPPLQQRQDRVGPSRHCLENAGEVRLQE